MKELRITAMTMSIVVIAALQAFAQQRQGATQPATSPTPAQTAGATTVPAKIAFVATEVFKDEKVGILRWLAADKKLQIEFQPKEKELLDIENRIQAINKELETLSKSPTLVDPKMIANKQDDVARLQREQKFKKEEGAALYKKRYEEVVGPVSADIVKALDAFARQRGITLLLEYGRLVELGAIVIADKSTDLTAAFIADYNSRNPVTATTAAPGR